MTESDLPEQLHDVVVTVEPIALTRLVHVDLGAAGLVLTVAQARGIARELDRAASRASRTARPRARRGATAAA